MGKPKFPRKKYDTPLHPWKEDRIKSERELIKKYGLKNHREIWKAKTRLKKYRQQSRELLAKLSSSDPQTKKETEQLLLHLTRLSILPQQATLDDVLTLDTESILSRRLQTLVYLKGLANTPQQARQLISHGHIMVNGTKVTVPGFIVTKDDEINIQYTVQSPLNELSHPARPKSETYTPAPKPAKKTQEDEVKPEETTKPETKQEKPVKQPSEEKKPEEEQPKEPQKDEPAPAVPEAEQPQTPAEEPAESPSESEKEQPTETPQPETETKKEEQQPDTNTGDA
jgi:small subunit ribosomal protein S4